MKIICLMGRSNSEKENVKHILEQLGFEGMISYTTRKPLNNETNNKTYRFIDVQQFNELITKDLLMEWTIYNNNYYGSPKPIGGKDLVVIVDSIGYRKIKDIYGSQVIGIYVNVISSKVRVKDKLDIQQRDIEDNKRFKDIENEVDIVISGIKDANTIVAEILSKLKCL